MLLGELAVDAPTCKLLFFISLIVALNPNSLLVLLP